MSGQDVRDDSPGERAGEKEMYIKTGGIFVKHTPYVLVGGAFQEADAYVISGGQWVPVHDKQG